MSHECSDRDLAEAMLSSTTRAHEEYRVSLRRLVHERTDEQLAELVEHFKASESVPREARIGDFLLCTDIRIACKQEQNNRAAWAAVDKEMG